MSAFHTFAPDLSGYDSVWDGRDGLTSVGACQPHPASISERAQRTYSAWYMGSPQRHRVKPEGRAIRTRCACGRRYSARPGISRCQVCREGQRHLSPRPAR